MFWQFLPGHLLPCCTLDLFQDFLSLSIHHGFNLSPILFLKSQQRHVAAFHHRHRHDFVQTATSPKSSTSPSRSIAHDESYLRALLRLPEIFEQSFFLVSGQATPLDFFSEITLTSTFIGSSISVGYLCQALMYFIDGLLHPVLWSNIHGILFSILVNLCGLMNHASNLFQKMAFCVLK